MAKYAVDNLSFNTKSGINNLVLAAYIDSIITNVTLE